ncbi:thermostable hemolysin [Vibrio sp. Vb0974]|uniref:thermostable hemolysin n=1 Tax=Vibrio sp. Vb0974 TaxID=3074635 RepID=UPI002963EDF1|nr:thermostable hemolysin [Vibrio sp. Vb0974]MDW1858908.1 thermostable hemolysin [Vibrio sp. Vb0974]
MKHHAQTSADGFTLDIVYPMHPLWSQVIEHVSQRYQEAFFAELKQFMPAYLTLIEGGQIISVCGFRIAEDEPLFLEQYLEDDAQKLVSNVFNCAVKRSNLVEFGHLASFAKGMSSLHFYLIAEMLVNLGFEWCIFTATDPLHAMMARLGLEPHIIAQADQNKVPDAESTWGSYYEHQPRVLAGNLQKGLERLRLVQERKRKQA